MKASSFKTLYIIGYKRIALIIQSLQNISIKMYNFIIINLNKYSTLVNNSYTSIFDHLNISNNIHNLLSTNSCL